MKIHDLPLTGVLQETIDEMEIDPTVLIMHDEFNKCRLTGSKVGYRNRGINRLVDSKLPIRSELNIGYELVTRFVQVTCPYCDGGSTMAPNPGGGNSHANTTVFVCQNCKARACLTLGGWDLTFNPA